MKSDYIPIDLASQYLETSKTNLQSSFLKNLEINKYRFFKKDNVLYVNPDYYKPFFHKLYDLYYIALQTAKCPVELSKQLSRMCNKNDKTIYKYFYRKSFRNTKSALFYKALLENYIKQNNLFSSEELGLRC